MFATLEITDKNTILRQPQIKSQRFNLPSGDAFFIVTADKHLGKIPWKKLENCLGILRNNMLLPDDITIPEGVNITKFTPDILPRIMLINSATDYIQNSKQIFRSKSLTIFDEKAIYQSYIEKLLPCFGNIKIVTDFTDSYKDLSAKLLETYGFSLIVSEDESFDSDVVITHQCNVPLYFEGTVFTNKRRYLMNGEVLCGSETDLPDLYESLRPDNIGRVLFASALYEKCSEKELASLRYKDFEC